ncbi:MAG TPA: hypothetical protein VFN96_10315 [Gemmatimonadales bacterium]|nr:hypothetical protein [Gemmatimonadales bacterium]
MTRLMRFACPPLAAALAVALSGLTSTPADAARIPAFARRYRLSCQVCHLPIPKLTAFGEQFAANGYRVGPLEEPRDTIGTGDPLLSLARDLPLAMRLDAYAQTYANGSAATDFQTPYIVKLFASGPISKKLSYYTYINLLERGEVGGFEDAVLIYNDLGGVPVDLQVGQFQISDPLFKRELRLSFEDYAVYRARIGAVPTDLTYDRGLLASAEVAGFDVVAEVMNGNGIGPADDARRFDNDAGKVFFGRLSRDLAGWLRLGAIGLTGRTTADGVDNRTTLWGFDGTFSTGPFELNGQYVKRRDDRPTYLVGEPVARTEGGFVEAVYRPAQSRWHAYGLYNRVTADRPLLDVRLGGPADSDRYESFSAGFGRIERRNVRWSLEGTWEDVTELFRLSLGLVTAF